MRCFVAGMVRFSIASGAYLSEYGIPYCFLYVLESHGQITLHHTILISFQINLNLYAYRKWPIKRPGVYLMLEVQMEALNR